MKLRIISGTLGGRTFNAPAGHKTHPMSEKMRGAIFNMLGDISGLTILDGYAGSGALSFEGLSRGAAMATAVEADKNAFSTIQENQTLLGTNLKISRANISSWLGTNPGVSFDIVLCDPPYDNLNKATLIQLAEATAPGGIVVYSLPPDSNFTLGDGYEKLAEKEYGDSTLVFYRCLG